MTNQDQVDIAFVLFALQSMPRLALRQHLDDVGNTEEDLDEAMRRLGEKVGCDAGLL